MTTHIGIVGCSAEGAALCYRTICTEGPGLMGRHAHPEITMHSHSLSAYTAALEAGDLDTVAALMLDSADKLARAGAGLLICPDNTIHQAMDRVLPRTPLPWLHIADVVAGAARRRGFERVGLLGTRWLVESDVYPERLTAAGIAVVRPDAATLAEIDRIILDELVAGVFRPEAVARHIRAITDLKAAGCDAVILGCTEIPLIVDDEASPLPTLDSTRLLARAALERAVAG